MTQFLTGYLPKCNITTSSVYSVVYSIIRQYDAETLIDASREVRLEVNAEITKYLLLSCHHNGGQNHNIKIANRSFENVAKFTHFGYDSNISEFDS
jgi:hypothetical protein